MTAALLAAGSRTFRSLRLHRNYRLFFAGQLVSRRRHVDAEHRAGLVRRRADALAASPSARSPSAASCPFTVFGLVAGVVADRIDNRRLVMATQVASMLVSIALAALAFSGAAEVWHAYLLAALGGTALVFDAPGRHALTFQIVGRDELPNAVALNASLFNASRVVGPAGRRRRDRRRRASRACFAVNAVSFLAVLASLLLMRADDLHSSSERASRRRLLDRASARGSPTSRHTPAVRTVAR